MRVGMMLAALAAMVFGAPEASAATFIQYQVTGTGTTNIYDIRHILVSTIVGQSFTATFDVLLSPSLTNDGYIQYATTGSVYSYNDTTNRESGGASAIIPGVITYNDNNAFTTGSVIDALSVNYSDPTGSTIFPTSVASSTASGTLSYNVAMYLNPTAAYSSFSGSISSFMVAGTTSTFLPLTFAVSGGSAVPEPASWGLMTVGAGAIGAALRQRRSRRPKLARP